MYINFIISKQCTFINKLYILFTFKIYIFYVFSGTMKIKKELWIQFKMYYENMN